MIEMVPLIVMAPANILIRLRNGNVHEDQPTHNPPLPAYQAVALKIKRLITNPANIWGAFNGIFLISSLAFQPCGLETQVDVLWYASQIPISVFEQAVSLRDPKTALMLGTAKAINNLVRERSFFLESPLGFLISISLPLSYSFMALHHFIRRH